MAGSNPAGRAKILAGLQLELFAVYFHAKLTNEYWTVSSVGRAADS